MSDRIMWDMAMKVESVGAELRNVSETFRVLEEIFEEEGYQRLEAFDQNKAIKFVKHFPAYMAMYGLLVGMVDNLSNRLLDLCQEMLEKRARPGGGDCQGAVGMVE